MKSFLVFFVTLLIKERAAFNNCSDIVRDNSIRDYYWREYLGVIPSDAIPGGFDKTNQRTYIGQMFDSRFGLLPSTIYKGSKHLLASGGGSSFTADTFVKILCSPNHNRYKWIPTENSKSHLLVDYHLVIGGNEAGYVLNIGRVNHESEIILGKVFGHNTPYRGLSIPYKSKESIYQSYEILVYDYCAGTTDLSASTERAPIDVRFLEPNVV